MHPAVVQACFTIFRDERIPEIPWEEPTVDEWRRAAIAIAETGYISLVTATMTSSRATAAYSRGMFSRRPT